MNFTDSPVERMMKQQPYTPHRDRYPDAPDDGRRDGKRRDCGKQGDCRRGLRAESEVLTKFPISPRK